MQHKANTEGIKAMEWFLKLNYIEMIMYIVKALSATLIVIGLFALAFWIFELLLGIVMKYIDRD